jgi:hypothetical protein
MLLAISALLIYQAQKKRRANYTSQRSLMMLALAAWTMSCNHKSAEARLWLTTPFGLNTQG